MKCRNTLMETMGVHHSMDPLPIADVRTSAASIDQGLFMSSIQVLGALTRALIDLGFFPSFHKQGGRTTMSSTSQGRASFTQ